jgi:hypothetical protein
LSTAAITTPCPFGEPLAHLLEEVVGFGGGQFGERLLEVDLGVLDRGGLVVDVGLEGGEVDDQLEQRRVLCRRRGCGAGGDVGRTVAVDRWPRTERRGDVRLVRVRPAVEVGEVDVDVGLLDDPRVELLEVAERELLEQPPRDGLAGHALPPLHPRPLLEVAAETPRTFSISGTSITTGAATNRQSRSNAAA